MSCPSRYDQWSNNQTFACAWRHTKNGLFQTSEDSNSMSHTCFSSQLLLACNWSIVEHVHMTLFACLHKWRVCCQVYTTEYSWVNFSGAVVRLATQSLCATSGICTLSLLGTCVWPHDQLVQLSLVTPDDLRLPTCINYSFLCSLMI